MGRRGRYAIVVGALLAFLLAACSQQTTITLYGRNDGAGDSWFALLPLADPPEAVGFGQDSGVACLSGSVGSAVAWLTRSPGEGGVAREVLGSVERGGSGSNIFWVVVAADGTLTKGEGVPAWWVGDAQAC